MFDKTIILNELEKLKQLIEVPKFYVNEKISDLKREIDLEYQSQLVKNHEKVDREKITLNWLELITFLDSFEDQCLKCQIKLETKLAAIDFIQEIEENFQDDVDKNQHLFNLIQNEIFKLESELTMNKTLLFIKSNNSNEESFIGCGFKLVELSNEFINWLTIYNFKNK
jgi:hypothetical protein